MTLSLHRDMHIELRGRRFRQPCRRRLQGILYRLEVVGILAFWVVDAVEFPEHLDEVRLAVEEQSRRQPTSAPQS